jgi:CubicO group peptidase (beta-lactamase class C family)
MKVFMNRRSFLHRLGSAATLAALSPAAAADLTPPTSAEQEAIREMALRFLDELGIKGLSVAYGRNGQIAFAQGYGFADAEGKEPVTPDHRFRIASVSKPITATAVMMSVEKGLLRLDSPVFGPGSLLEEAYGRDLPEPVRAITVDHLLTHSSGGWANDKDDPMFRNPAMNHDELIAWTLRNQRQTHAPGEHYAYSNFGYCVLGRVLETVTKQPYATLVTQQALTRCGISDMRIGGNTLADRQPLEVMYHTEKPGGAYGMNVARMDSHGGWIATARDLVRFASQLKQSGPQTGLLTEESIRTMTRPGVKAGYARGWSVNPVPNWWHGGSLPGTSTILVHTAKGLCWAGLLNGRTEGVSSGLDKLMWNMGRAVMSWHL